jgi:PAS domain S-box-containing protein
MTKVEPAPSIEERFLQLEREVAERTAALRRRERDLKAILDTMPSMIGYWDSNLRNRFGNHAYLAWFGIDPAVMPGMHIRDVIGEERYALNLPYIEGALRGERQQFERAIPTPDGSSVRYSLAEYLPDIEDGEVVGFFALVTDVTRLKQAEFALRDSETRFRRLFEDTAEPLLLVEDDCFVDANPAAVALLGLAERAQVVGRTLTDFCPALQADGKSSAERFSAMIAEARERGSVLAEWELLRAGGGAFVAELLLTSIHDPGRRLLHMVMRDITRRKTLEAELRRSNLELERFAYVASHDLRQPLRMVSSYLSLLERRLGDGLDEQSRTFIGFAVDGAKRMDRMITDLLDYSRIGRDGSTKAPVDLNQVVERVLGDLKGAIADAGADVTIAGRLPAVPGYTSEIERLLLNLIGNAIKFRRPGEAPKVVVDCREAGREWVLSVADNGIGLPPGAEKQLFTIFRRLVTSSEYEGNGIGLAACRKIAEDHGGRIWVESEEGRGSTFLVALPK